jgi:hypothetical protein
MSDKKWAQARVRYRPHTTGRDRCELCTMFVRPHGCTAVEGKISPTGWCEIFEREPKSGS